MEAIATLPWSWAYQRLETAWPQLDRGAGPGSCRYPWTAALIPTLRFLSAERVRWQSHRPSWSSVTNRDRVPPVAAITSPDA